MVCTWEAAHEDDGAVVDHEEHCHLSGGGCPATGHPSTRGKMVRGARAALRAERWGCDREWPQCTWGWGGEHTLALSLIGEMIEGSEWWHMKA